MAIEANPAVIDGVAGFLHWEHLPDDPRPLKGYNHCECLDRAKRYIELVHEIEAAVLEPSSSTSLSGRDAVLLGPEGG